ncbi:hypothetical protein I5P64_05705 [Serratia ureilytica]|uniref:hypothetical protein n=1 Tax=Serratia ureilytica TaxID=300181 RepID=UPI0018D86EB7|nr:hypothetical protein [Serratia ureilytica]MBH2662520.1 hypothetical protein [Serratia ureilytica]
MNTMQQSDKLNAENSEQITHQLPAPSPATSHIEQWDAIIFYVILFVAVIIIAWLLIKFHKAIILLLENLVSFPVYKRSVALVIGVISTLVTSILEPKYYYIPILLGYILTFAFNEFSTKKDIEKAKSPLEQKISDLERSITLFRTIIEEKKNNFHSIVLIRLSNCLRVNGKNDGELLQGIKKNIEDLQDIILAEKTFMETPDEAFRRYDNSKSGDTGLASQTMIGTNNNLAMTSN